MENKLFPFRFRVHFFFLNEMSKWNSKYSFVRRTFLHILYGPYCTYNTDASDVNESLLTIICTSNKLQNNTAIYSVRIHTYMRGRAVHIPFAPTICHVFFQLLPLCLYEFFMYLAVVARRCVCVCVTRNVEYNFVFVGWSTFKVHHLYSTY